MDDWLADKKEATHNINIVQGDLDNVVQQIADAHKIVSHSATKKCSAQVLFSIFLPLVCLLLLDCLKSRFGAVIGFRFWWSCESH